jgi:hypothetical protein
VFRIVFKLRGQVGKPRSENSVPWKIDINFLQRHGSRFPTASDITKLEQLRRALSSHHELLNKTDYLWMLNWTDPYKFQTAGNLDKNGATNTMHSSSNLFFFYRRVGTVRDRQTRTRRV